MGEEIGYENRISEKKETNCTSLLGRSAAMSHMENGGQVFRVTSQDRFFYKIDGGVLMCRCNELGGWHPSARPLRDSDEIYVATVDWHSSMFPDRVWTTPLPLPSNREGGEAGTPGDVSVDSVVWCPHCLRHADDCNCCDDDVCSDMGDK